MECRGRVLLLFSLILVGAALLTAPLASADSISPTTFTASGPTGFTATVNKTVTINAGAPTTSLVDVFFLSDTTGSMSPSIAAVRGAASSILTSTAGLGDVRFGVGEYKDVGDPFVYRMDSDVSAGATSAANQAAAIAGIGLWTASGGGDLPEANLFALEQAATTTAWRPGSARILVWFGDAPGHDPRNGSTEASAIAALNANNVKVEGISVTTGPGLNAACGDGTCTAGQGSRIATATGGSLTTGVSTDAVVAAISAAITEAFATYSSVCLDTSGAPAGVTATSSPCFTGSFDRSIDRTFGFNVTFKDNEPGTHVFDIFATVDGGRVATEHDTIISRGVAVPEPSSMLLLGTGLLGLAAFGRRFVSK